MSEVVDLSVPALPTVVDGIRLKGPQFNPPPSDMYHQVVGEISKAVDSLGDARGGFVFLHDKAQTGDVNRSNAVFVQKLNDQWAIMAWVAKDWNHSGLGWGVATTVKWGSK